jgi:hypothetical protein
MGGPFSDLCQVRQVIANADRPLWADVVVAELVGGGTRRSWETASPADF